MFKVASGVGRSGFMPRTTPFARDRGIKPLLLARTSGPVTTFDLPTFDFLPLTDSQAP
jgi:hypothetical protein